MACLNLPLSICYKPENMYIAGIINGPREPQLSAINHYMRPLVDDLALLWQRGVWFSKTAMCPSGRMTCSAVATTVCDLPRAHKAAQLASHGFHNYCSVCQYFETWKQRDTQEMRRIVDPTQQLVVDSMHCILERVVQGHVCNALELSMKAAKVRLTLKLALVHTFSKLGSHDTTEIDMTPKEIKQVEKLQALLLDPVYGSNRETQEQGLDMLQENLLKHNLGPLKFVCQDLECTFPMKRLYKADYAKAVIQWCHGKPMSGGHIPIKLTTQAVMEHVRDILNNTVTPSWLNSVPYNFGESAARMLKVNEWHTLSTMYLPLALVSSWGAGTTHQDAETARRLRATLDHTMTLFSAVHLVCMWTMMKARMSSYRSNMATYIKDLKKIHPTIKHTTSHHMALHIYDFLGLFGPVHSWWCFPFERLIGILQQQPSNHKFGELETTMLQAFIRGEKLHRWLGRPDCPPALKECKKLFEKAYLHKGYQYAGTQDDAEDTPLQSKTFPEDFLHFYPGGNKNSLPVPGSIQHFLPRREPVLRCDVLDPFKPYAHFPTKLYSPKLSGQLEVVKVDWVVSHYARWPISLEHVVVLSLSRD
ncbi:hypothetical protein K439DRAFT_1647409 [Ramaria rubella]|nr:hypothetical protein K439DRAFT_1647409 [Ramaria rubella]